MNAAQNKSLIAAARKARQTLLEIQTQCGQCQHPAVTLEQVQLRAELAALELWPAIRHAETVKSPTSKPAGVEKCVFCELAGADIGGYAKKGKLRMAHVTCAEAYDARAASFAAWCEQPRESRFTTKEEMQYCACGGKAEDHRKDRDDNLLECSHCADCDHFRYPVARAA